MDNQISVFSLRMKCSVVTSPDSKSVILENLYYRFQTRISRSTSGVGRWSTFDSIPDLVQVGRHIFAGF